MLAWSSYPGILEIDRGFFWNKKLVNWTFFVHFFSMKNLKLLFAGVLAAALLAATPALLPDRGSHWLRPASMSVIKDVQDMSVNVLTESGQGSGVIFRSDWGGSYAITAAHVVEGIPYHGKVQVTQRGYTWDAVVINSDAERDLAVLRIERPRPVGTAARLLDKGTALPIGTRLLHVGNTLGFNGSYLEGVLTATNRLGGEFSQTSILAWPGSSGGGVFTTDGRLVGVITRGIGPGLNFMIPAELIRRYALENDLQWLLQ